MNCIVCDSPMKKTLRDLHTCPKCSLISSSYAADNSIYDEEYYNRYKHYSKTILGEKINRFRWNFVSDHINGGLVLDYGCGCGHFIDMRPPGLFFTDGYDINPMSPYSGRQLRGHYTAVTFWDSIEHMDNPMTVLKEISSDWLFMTVPDPTDFKVPLNNWLHYRPHEHIHHFTIKSLTVMLDRLGYEIVSFSNGEGELRNPKNPTWILTAGARRKNGRD